MKQLNGLFLDPRIWQIDYLSSPFWKPEQFGISIDLHPDAFHIPSRGLNNKYDFVIATEIWEIPMRKTLEYLRKQGLPIFLVPREILPTEAYFGQMFNSEKYKYNDTYYFSPDKLLAPSPAYADLWKDKLPTTVVGYPRFDIYVSEQRPKRDDIVKRYNLQNKKIIFFPSYPPYHMQTIDNNEVMVDLYDDLQNTLAALESYALKNGNTQVVVKIHPMAQKCYNKKIGKGNEVAGLLEKYYLQPTNYMKVIGDERNKGSIARDLLIASDFVIGFTSVMLLEAINENKPALHLLFKQASKLKDLPTYSSSIKTVKNPKELLDALGDDPNKCLLSNKDVVEKYLYKIDGLFCERLCTEIRNCLEKKGFK